jgi:hypothetical protein
MALGKLGIDLEARLARFQGDMGRAAHIANRRMGEIQRSSAATAASLKNLGLQVTRLAVLFGAGFGIAAITNSFAQMRDEIDKIAKTSTQLGMTTEALSSLQYVAGRSGVTAEQLSTAFMQMTKRMSEAARGTGAARNALDELGLSAAKLATMTPDQQFMEIARAMENVKNQSDKVRIAMELWGRGGAPLVQMLADGTKGIEELMERAKQLGIVIDEDMARKMEEAADVVGDLNQAWRGLKIAIAAEYGPAITQAIIGMTDAIVNMREGVIDLLRQLGQLARNPLVMALMGGAAGSRLGPYGAVAGGVGGLFYGLQLRNYEEVEKGLRRAQGLDHYDALAGFYGADIEPPRSRTLTGTEADFATGGRGRGRGGGARAAKDTTAQLMSLIDTLNKELARLSEGSLAEISRWYDEVIGKVGEWATSQDEAAQVMALAMQVRKAKEQKVAEDFENWYIGAVQDRVAQVLSEEKRLLREFEGIQGAKEHIAEVTETKLAQIGIERETTRLNLLRDYLGQMAGLAPLYSTQLQFQEKILEIERQLADHRLKSLLLSKEITPEIYEQAKALQAVVDQAKQFTLEQEKWKTQGVGGGLKAWAFSRPAEAEERGYYAGLDMMRQVEQQVGQGIGDAFVGFVLGEGGNLAEIGFRIAEAFFRKGVEQLTAMAFDQIAAMIGGVTEQTQMIAAATTAATIQTTAATTSAATTTGAAATAGATLTTAGATLAASMISGATSAAAIMAGAKGVGLVGGLFHGGGIVMHGGGIVPRVYTAHAGLSLKPDERLIRAQTGEGILPRSAMSRIGSGGFERLRQGEGGAMAEVVVHQHIHGVRDLNTWKATGTQIAARAAHQTRESMRNL